MEVMIALGILSFVIFSIGVLIPLSQVRVQSGTDRDVAYTLADNMIESVRALGFDDIMENRTYSGTMPAANPGTYYQYPPRPYPSVTVTNYYPGQRNTVISHDVQYSYSVRADFARNKSGDIIPNLKTLVVTVSWHQADWAGKGNERSITISSRIIKR